MGRAVISWSAEEISRVENIAGEYPYPMLAHVYNSWADKAGYPRRTSRAIEAIAKRLGHSLRPTGKWVTSGYVASLLGIPQSTVSGWIYNKHLPRRIKRPTTYILRSDLVALASRKPQFFSSIDADRLYALFEDRELADTIAATYKKKDYWKKPVRIVETGVVYESVMEASRRVPIVHTEIRKALRHGRTAAGYHWEYVQ